MENKPYNPNLSTTPAPVLPDNMAEAIISTDNNLKIKSWNKAAEDLYGLPKQEVIDQYLPALICFAFVNNSFSGFIGQLARTLYWKGDILHIRKDGILKCISSSVNAVCGDADEIFGYVMVSRDEHQPGTPDTGLRGIFDTRFQYVGLVNDHAAEQWSIVLHWHEPK